MAGSITACKCQKYELETRGYQIVCDDLQCLKLKTAKARRSGILALILPMQGLSDKEEIMLYWDDVSDSFDGWMNLLRQLGGDSFINFEQDIWETARTYETVPHFGNLRQHHLLERLQDTIRNRW